MFWFGEGTRYVEYQTLSYGTEGVWNAGWHEPDAFFSDDISADSFGATIWSGRKVRVEENIQVGETADSVVYNFLFPGMFALALAVFYWPAVLILTGLVGIYWSLSSSMPTASRRSAR